MSTSPTKERPNLLWKWGKSAASSSSLSKSLFEARNSDLWLGARNSTLIDWVCVGQLPEVLHRVMLTCAEEALAHWNQHSGLEEMDLAVKSKQEWLSGHPANLEDRFETWRRAEQLTQCDWGHLPRVLTDAGWVICHGTECDFHLLAKSEKDPGYFVATAMMLTAGEYRRMNETLGHSAEETSQNIQTIASNYLDPLLADLEAYCPLVENARRDLNRCGP